MSENFPDDKERDALRRQHSHREPGYDQRLPTGDVMHCADHGVTLAQFAELSIAETDHFVILDGVANRHRAVRADRKPHGVMAANL